MLNYTVLHHRRKTEIVLSLHLIIMNMTTLEYTCIKLETFRDFYIHNVIM